LNLVRDALSGIPTLAKEIRTEDDVTQSVLESDMLYVVFHCLRRQQRLPFSRNEIPEMIATLEPLNSGFPLSDPNDARYTYITSLKRRFGEFLHVASTSLRQQGEYNTVDAVTILVSAGLSPINEA
jgi:proteasome activator subunit 4